METLFVPIIVACITGGLSLVGVIITNNNSNKQIQQQLFTSQAITDTKLENLTDEVRKHNEFATKVPILENRVSRLEEDVKDLKDGSKQHE